MTKEVARLEIRGHAQSVGYRWSMAEQARRLGVTGWVRNRRVGSVEATFAGRLDAAEKLVAWARRGPFADRVDSVDVFEAAGDFADFKQLPTA